MFGCVVTVEQEPLIAVSFSDPQEAIFGAIFVVVVGVRICECALPLGEITLESAVLFNVSFVENRGAEFLSEHIPGKGVSFVETTSHRGLILTEASPPSTQDK